MTKFPKLFKRMLPSSRITVDRSESKAFLHSTRTRSIVINKKFFNNISDYKNFLNDLRNKLLNLRDPETGSKVISNVFMREEIYSGKYVDRLPDLYLELADGYLIRGDFGELLVDSFPAPRPDHCANGILIGYGADITKAKQIYGSSIIDLCTNLLASFRSSGS